MKLKLIADRLAYDIDDQFNRFMDANKDIEVIKINTSYSGDKHMIYIFYYTFDELRSKKINKLKSNIEFTQDNT